MDSITPSFEELNAEMERVNEKLQKAVKMFKSKMEGGDFDSEEWLKIPLQIRITALQVVNEQMREVCRNA